MPSEELKKNLVIIFKIIKAQIVSCDKILFHYQSNKIETGSESPPMPKKP